MFSASEQFNQRRDSSALKTLLDRSLVRPDEYGDIGTAQLSKEEREQLQVLWDKLIPAYEENQFRIVFRGEKKKNIEKKLFRHYEDYHPGKMYCIIGYFILVKKLNIISRKVEITSNTNMIICNIFVIHQI